jgi:hypothetical protein
MAKVPQIPVDVKDWLCSYIDPTNLDELIKKQVNKDDQRSVEAV